MRYLGKKCFVSMLPNVSAKHMIHATKILEKCPSENNNGDKIFTTYFISVFLQLKHLLITITINRYAKLI